MAFYAGAAAAQLPPLPLQRVLLLVFAAVLLVRALAFPWLKPVFPDNSARFWRVSSGICLVMALAHGWGRGSWLDDRWRVSARSRSSQSGPLGRPVTCSNAVVQSRSTDDTSASKRMARHKSDSAEQQEAESFILASVADRLSLNFDKDADLGLGVKPDESTCTRRWCRSLCSSRA
jgi:hypothetical protein